jgi:hypothetical protein
LWNDDLSILAVDIGALDRAIVQVGNTHIGPIKCDPHRYRRRCHHRGGNR